jgi:hypothetical protein
MAFEHNPHLMELGLSADEVGSDVWDKFCALFSKKKALMSPDDLAYDTILDDSICHIVEEYM